MKNPYTRMPTCYLDKIAGNKPQKRKILNALGMDQTDLKTSVEFEEFIEVIGKQEPKKMDQHWCTQYYQLFGGLVKFDHIGKVENIDEDLKVIDKRLGGMVLKHHENVLWHQIDAKCKLSHNYNDRIAEKVLKVY